MRNEQVEDIMLPTLKLYCRASYKMKTVWYWNQNRYTDKWNGIESSEINPSLLGLLIYDKGDKSKHRSNDSLLNSDVGKTGQLHAKK